jgi:DNA repair protein RecN (Recombination protein N)
MFSRNTIIEFELLNSRKPEIRINRVINIMSHIFEKKLYFFEKRAKFLFTKYPIQYILLLKYLLLNSNLTLAAEAPAPHSRVILGGSMLKFLKIKDFALIESLELELESGLVTITGETGSGKSLVLDAISSLLGAKCNTMNIRSGEKKYQLEALFSIDSTCKNWLDEKGIEFESDEIYIKKELFSDGKSRIQMGSSLAPAGFLKEFGNLLSEVHRQNDQSYLLEKSTQLEYLDRFSGLASIKKEFSEKFKTFSTLKKRFLELNQSSDEKLKQIDLLKYQIGEISAAKLIPAEEEQLINYSIISEILSEAETSVLKGLSKILSASEKIESINPEFSGTRKEFYEIYDRLKDISHSIIDEQDEIFFSEDRLSSIQDRLDTIYRLKKKYGFDIAEILSFLEKAKIELETIENSETDILSLEKEMLSSRESMTELAVKLSNLRRNSILKLESSLQKEFQDLGLKNAKLQIVMRWEQAIEGELYDGDKKYLVSESGLDHVDFYFSANAGEKPRPLRKIISGGEMSRVTLALKSILGNERILVFDEIDSGVGGETAFRLAEKLKSISKDSQVILITHSQQIAALSDIHLVVSKNVVDNRTSSQVSIVDKENRATELAKMISGEHITKGAMEHAKELLKKAV